MTLQDRLKKNIHDMEELGKVENETIINGVNRKLGLMQFQQRLADMYKPITSKIDEQIKSATENTNKTLAAIESSKIPNTTGVTLTQKLNPRTNNAFFSLMLSENNIEYYGLNNASNVASLIYDRTNNNLDIVSKDGKKIPIKPSQGLLELLLRKDVELSIVEKEDYDNWLNIYRAMGLNPGTSNKVKSVYKKFNNGKIPEDLKYKKPSASKITELNQPLIPSSPLIIEDVEKGTVSTFSQRLPSNYTGEGIIIIPPSIKEIKKRVLVLSANYKAGHDNVLDELTSLLDVLLKKKKIKYTEYLQYVDRK